MKLTSLGPIIASRALTDAQGGAVRVLIGKPRRYRGGHADYYCPFIVKGVDVEIQHAGGVDAVQALQLAMKAIGTRLSHPGLDLRWDAGLGSGDLGFPGAEAQGQANRQLQNAVTTVFVKAFRDSVKATRRVDGSKRATGEKAKERRKRQVRK